MSAKECNDFQPGFAPVRQGRVRGHAGVGPMDKCRKCGSTRIEEGKLEGLSPYGAVGFHPTRIRFLTLKTKIPIVAWVCLDCGFLELGCDTDSLRDIMTEGFDAPLPS